VLVLAGTTLYTHPRYTKGVGFYGFIVATINLFFLFGSNTPILEWFTVFTALGYVGLLAYNMTKLPPKPEQVS
jgi:multisubunit Na+/H+ antiporter MnhE subunit